MFNQGPQRSASYAERIGMGWPGRDGTSHYPRSEVIRSVLRPGKQRGGEDSKMTSQFILTKHLNVGEQ